MTITTVSIIGGGIAGPVTAMAMQRAGLDPVVYEAHDHGADGVGAFLTLATNGLEGLHLLDLDRQVAGLGMDTRRMRIVSGTGKQLAEFDNGGLTSFGTPSQTLRRADLYRTLRDEAVRRGVRIEYGKQLRDARLDGDRVHADFTDGTTAEGDLLVGADGLRSRTRSVLDPHAPDPRYLGLLNTGGFATGLALDGEPGAAHFLFGKRCFFGYLIHPRGDVWWFANPGRRTEPSTAELASITPEQQRAELTELFSRDAGPALEIIDATEHIIRSWSTYDLPTVPTWRNERMVIIGDAAHATSPSSGQGGVHGDRGRRRARAMPARTPGHRRRPRSVRDRPPHPGRANRRPGQAKRQRQGTRTGRARDPRPDPADRHADGRPPRQSALDVRLPDRVVTGRGR
ncbi:FAD-dependent oxidoreductase [Rhodococcus wratislaviensis]|uniref:FAD-dependent oxidoreductase n=1 Tax=Rhodococcus wratislaviensis TaxID=44752 RepID=UPI0036690D65